MRSFRSSRHHLWIAGTALLLLALLAPTTAASSLPLVDDALSDFGSDLTGWIYTDETTSMTEVVRAVGADRLHDRGLDGSGVDVALIDTGALPVPGLDPARVRNGADLSFEAPFDELRYLDSFGHGTHLAGIIAGRPRPGHTDFTGVAPGARLLSLKLAGYSGATDVSQVIAAIDWVVEHRRDRGLNIRVLNLSFGTDGVQDHEVDPLTHAVWNAWREGVVVVVSGGNAGLDSLKLNNPAHHPGVIAVGAADTNGSRTALDDTVPTFSSRGARDRRVDLVAPGQSIASLRAPGSFVDDEHPGARVGDHLFKGSGTSQAAAVVSGAVALLLQERPELTPAQVKWLLRRSASFMPRAGSASRGAGLLNVAAAARRRAPDLDPVVGGTRGTGSLEQARGSLHVGYDDFELRGERDLFGRWDAQRWAQASIQSTAWRGGRWMERRMTRDCWCTTSWAGPSWSGISWRETVLRRHAVPSEAWPGKTWSGKTWSGKTWSGEAWSGKTWSGRAWS